MASTVDKVKHALHLDKDKSTSHTTGTAEGVHGPHSTRVANAADPRIDSDLDGSRNAGAHTHNATGTGYTGTTTGQTTTAGPHSSNLANKLDPRVDSNLSNQHSTTGTTNHHYGRDAAVGAGAVGLGEHEHRKHEGLTGHGNASTGLTGTGAHDHHYGRDAAVGAGAVGLGEHEHRKHEGVTGHGTTGQTTTAGPHSSNLANKLDPRVDSDRSNQYGTTGAGIGSTGAYNNNNSNTNTFGNAGTTGGISNSTNAGPHDSNLMNKLDPRVDSDLSGRGNNHGAAHGGLMSGTHATPGSGTAQNTAGPHNSDTMNKIDPRVDAGLDGSRTIGGNRTNY